MKAILLTHVGNPDILRVVEMPDPFPAANEVRIKINAIGLNYSEGLSRKGQYPWAPPLPYIPGVEACGVIDMVGDDVKHRKVGQKVIAGAMHGSYAEYMIVKENQTMPVMRGFSMEENAAYAVHYLTAWVALFEDARVRKGDVVLVHAAAGGVGTAAIQLLRHAGCRVIGAVGSDAKCKIVQKLGVDLAVNYNTPGWDKLIHQKYKNGVNVVLSSVSGDIYHKSRNLLAPLGKIVVIGLAGLEFSPWNPVSLYRAWKALPRPDIRNMMVNSYGISAFHLGWILPDTELVSGIWKDLTAFTQKHKIRPVIGAVFDFKDMPQAHRLMESRESAGKIIVKI